MPATERLLQRLQETLGDDLTHDLVTWVDEARTVNRAELREIADLYLARLDERLERRLAESEAKLKAEFKADLAAFKAELKAELTVDLGAVRAAIKEDLAALRVETKEDLAALRVETRAELSRILHIRARRPAWLELCLRHIPDALGDPDYIGQRTRGECSGAQSSDATPAARSYPAPCRPLAFSAEENR